MFAKSLRKKYLTIKIYFMRNLESFGVQKLSHLETKKTEGGILLEIHALWAIALYGAYMAGYNAGANA